MMINDDEHGGIPQPALVSQALRALFDIAKQNRAWNSLERVLRGRAERSGGADDGKGVHQP